MTILVLELRVGDLLIVNGAPIRFRNRTRIELTGRARFLFGKQIMAVGEATSPLRQIYFALQTAYIGTDDERAGGLELARGLVADYGASGAADALKQPVERALAAAEADDSYVALKLIRRLIRLEDTAVGQDTVGLLEAAG
jgi:flagellar protein FlbT